MIFDESHRSGLGEVHVNALRLDTVSHRYTKHIDITMKYCKEIVRKGDFQVLYTESAANVADIFTKPLSCDKFRKFRDQLLNLNEFQEVAESELMFNLTTFFDEQEQEEKENQMSDDMHVTTSEE